MKTRVSFSLIFLCLFLLTQKAISGKFTDNKSYGPFSFSGSTISTSSKLSGYGQDYWSVSGSASISGNAIELGQDRVYQCELWLMATGDLVSSPFPGKGNIAAEAESDGNGGKRKVVPAGDAKILYLSRPVGSIVPGEVNIYDSQVTRELSESLSESYTKGSPSSPTDLCASPEIHGELSGVLMNFSGSQTVDPVSFKSKENKACAESLDDGTEVIAAEKCKRRSLCQKPGTATSEDNHKVWCDKFRWVQSQNLIAKSLAGTFGITRKVKEKCKGFWWTCDDDPNDYTTFNICQHVAAHVPDSESHLEEKYVDSSGNTVDPNTVTRNCGHLLSASGDHTLQASCSEDTNCIATGFYLCQHETHEYADEEVITAETCEGCNRPKRAGETNHIQQTCSTGLGCGQSYWKCNPYDYNTHARIYYCLYAHIYKKCTGHTCETNSNGNVAPATGSGNSGQGGFSCAGGCPDTSLASPTQHRVVCQSDQQHAYYSCDDAALSKHQAQTCLRCGGSYHRCENHRFACGGSNFHTLNPEAYKRGACGHRYRIRDASAHRSVACTVENAQGQVCTATDSYACQSHTHTYSRRQTTPSNNLGRQTSSTNNGNNGNDGNSGNNGNGNSGGFRQGNRNTDRSDQAGCFLSPVRSTSDDRRRKSFHAGELFEGYAVYLTELLFLPTFLT